LSIRPITNTPKSDQARGPARLADGEQVERDRRPDQRRADRGQQREERHHHAPEHRRVHAERPEGEAAERALRRGDQDVALDGGADHGGEALEQPLLGSAPSGIAARISRATPAPSRRRKNSRYIAISEADDQVERLAADVDRAARRAPSSLGVSAATILACSARGRPGPSGRAARVSQPGSTPTMRSK
jgi:hypothetical protein